MIYLPKVINSVTKESGISTQVYMAQISTFSILGLYLLLFFTVERIFLKFMHNIIEEFEIKKKKKAVSSQ